MSGSQNKFFNRDKLVYLLRLLKDEMRIDSYDLYDAVEYIYGIDIDVPVEIKDEYNSLISMEGPTYAIIGEPYACTIVVNEDKINSYYYSFIHVYMGDERVISYLEGDWDYSHEETRITFNFDIPIVDGELRIEIRKDEWE